MKIPNPNGWHIVVVPRNAGDFGFVSMSGVKYTPKEAEDLQDEITNEIKRHIDNISHCSVEYTGFVCSECGSFMEELEEKCTYCKN
jgi:hypothetical protein